MTISAVITLPATDFALGEVLSETGVRIELPQFVQIADNLIPYLWVHGSDHDQNAFIQRVEADDRVEKLEVVDDLSEKTLYRIEWVNGIDDFLDLLIEHEVWVEQANTLSSEENVDERAPEEGDVGTGADVWRFQLRGSEREALSAFYNDCIELGMDLGIQQIITSPEKADGSQWDITDKQHEAIMLAHDGGYFETPRRASLTDLADGCGISHQAFSRRLMRGLDSVLTNTVAVENVFRNENDQN